MYSTPTVTLRSNREGFSTPPSDSPTSSYSIFWRLACSLKKRNNPFSLNTAAVSSVFGSLAILAVTKWKVQQSTFHCRYFRSTCLTWFSVQKIIQKIMLVALWVFFYYLGLSDSSFFKSLSCDFSIWMEKQNPFQRTNVSHSGLISAMEYRNWLFLDAFLPVWVLKVSCVARLKPHWFWRPDMKPWQPWCLHFANSSTGKRQNTPILGEPSQALAVTSFRLL